MGDISSLDPLRKGLEEAKRTMSLGKVYWLIIHIIMFIWTGVLVLAPSFTPLVRWSGVFLYAIWVWGDPWRWIVLRTCQPPNNFFFALRIMTVQFGVHVGSMCIFVYFTIFSNSSIFWSDLGDTYILLQMFVSLICVALLYHVNWKVKSEGTHENLEGDILHMKEVFFIWGVGWGLTVFFICIRIFIMGLKSEGEVSEGGLGPFNYGDFITLSMCTLLNAWMISGSARVFHFDNTPQGLNNPKTKGDSLSIKLE